MDRISVEEYKYFLVDKYNWEYDNNEAQRQKRLALLNSRYSHEYLEQIIIGTYDFANKIIEMYENNYYGYIKLPLENEPQITHIDLSLMGGWKSDIVVRDSLNNFYSVRLLKKIFGERFYIKTCEIEIDEELDEDDDISILSEIPSYYLYIQCKKEIIDNVKNEKVLRITKKNC